MRVKKEKVHKLRTDRDGLGECLHAALRKCCDSKVTSLLWNVIGLLDEKVWEMYLDHVWVRLQVAEKTGTDFSHVLKEASLSFEDEVYRRPAERRQINNQHLSVLALTFELMATEDWEGYVAFLEADVVGVLEAVAVK